MDLSVAVAPLYFGTMAAERAVQRRRAQRSGHEWVPGAGDYTRADTTTSLGMGVLSLTTPVTAFLVGRAVPFRTGRRGTLGGRVGMTVLGISVVSAAATTVADRIAARADTSSESGRRAHRRARRVAEVGGVAAVATGGVVVAATSAFVTSTSRLWAKGRHRDLGNGVLPWTIGMVGWDLGYYGNHRLMHEVRALWAIHVPHHSSERYNLSTALRQPVASAFGAWLPYSVMTLFGVRPFIIETSRALNLMYQYWVHTEMIGSLGAAEAVLSTPSHHRVHHGSNRRYLDRNHGGILIVWDRLFGTFQRELPDVDPVVYGLTRNVGSHNLWTVSTHEYREIFRDVARSTTWRDRLGFVLRGPGWATRRRGEIDGSTQAPPALHAA
jgi:sterol desaturase/sphingolipid hydroxylase (fatty acid hydroxylase superfamily)